MTTTAPPDAVPDSGVMTAISRAELDTQITTARAYPRDMRRFMDECLQMATLNEQIAAECIYAVERAGEMVEGPSARLAEIVASAWGNCRAGARVVEEGREFLTAQGVFHDLERNVQITMEVRRRITTKTGKRYGADMIGVTGNAACSVALRNAVFKGIPKAFWSEIYTAARQVAVGSAATLPNKRRAALDYLQKQGVTPEMVLAKLGLESIEDIEVDHLATLRGLANAIKEGEQSVEQAFQPTDAEPRKPKRNAVKDAIDKKKTENEHAEEEQPESWLIDAPEPPEHGKPGQVWRNSKTGKEYEWNGTEEAGTWVPKT